jgi:3-deoxy-7-phosphoheptulonate synthase
MTYFPTPENVKHEIPLSASCQEKIQGYRESICRILTGQDPRLLLIVGPCSIHDEESALDYGVRLSVLSETVQDHFMLVMRTYVEKARTKNSWKGFLYDPNLDGSYDIESGIYRSRKLMKALTEYNLPLACEFLDPMTAPYYADYISWGCIGARTVQSPLHRQLAASLEMPIGCKNRTDGCIDSACHACSVCKAPHHFLAMNEKGVVSKVHALGNCMPHLVLRGASHYPNYDTRFLLYAKEKMLQAGLTPSIIVDSSHDNSMKNHLNQPHVFMSVLDSLEDTALPVRGLMLESFLDEGGQVLSKSGVQKIQKSVSLTDSCLDWNATKDLIERAHEKLAHRGFAIKDLVTKEFATCT